ncbi:MFS transporter [Arthrobacter livingstonensis]|uniref:MFS transporter n=1 Tax=Arthrobacter livingstonensis TaxID=670078 RepID=A0A2V5LFW9_9MICC|nr:MFS transporter [Arthrobacter livingstonensis]PYI65280.1 MFS transporter [Arthrobacter livingstonensis]
MEPAALGSQEQRSQVRKAAVASTIGTTIEWYDYFLYGAAAALVFPHVFFPHMSPYLGLISAFATYFVGFLARPVGAAIFGHWGDRIGRKAMLIITLLMMGISTALIGALPGAEAWGEAAPIILIILRVFQGIAVGGEWGGSILLSMEWGDQKRRGLMASWPQLGVAIGIILSTGLMALFNGIMGTDAFIAWGWRIPFLLSLVLVAIGLYIRLKIMETPMFAAVVKTKKTEKAPVLEVIRRYPKEIILSALLRMSEQMPFYIVTAFVLSYLTDKNHNYSYNFVLIGTMVAAALELFFVPFFGHLSDKMSRLRIYQLGAAITGVWGFVYFALLDSGIGWLVFLAVCVALIPHAMQYGPQASIIAENFPTNLRYTGAGLGYQLASIIAGGPAALVATILLHNFGTGYAVSVYILVSALITIAATLGLKDYSRSDISDPDTYSPRVKGTRNAS